MDEILPEYLYLRGICVSPSLRVPVQIIIVVMLLSYILAVFVHRTQDSQL